MISRIGIPRLPWPSSPWPTNTWTPPSPALKVRGCRTVDELLGVAGCRRRPPGGSKWSPFRFLREAGLAVFAVVAGAIEYYLPERILTNDELAVAFPRLDAGENRGQDGDRATAHRRTRRVLPILPYEQPTSCSPAALVFQKRSISSCSALSPRTTSCPPRPAFSRTALIYPRVPGRWITTSAAPASSMA